MRNEASEAPNYLNRRLLKVYSGRGYSRLLHYSAGARPCGRKSGCVCAQACVCACVQACRNVNWRADGRARWRFQWVASTGSVGVSPAYHQGSYIVQRRYIGANNNYVLHRSEARVGACVRRLPRHGVRVRADGGWEVPHGDGLIAPASLEAIVLEKWPH